MFEQLLAAAMTDQREMLLQAGVTALLFEQLIEKLESMAVDSIHASVCCSLCVLYN